MRSLRLLVALTFAFCGLACSASTTKVTSSDDDQTKKADDESSSANPSSAPAPAPPPTPAPVPTTITPGKISDGPVSDFVVTNDALFLINGGSVQRAAVDGTAPTPLPALADARALASDGVRLYALVGSGRISTLVSTKLDGTEPQTGLAWDGANGLPTTLSVGADRVFLGVQVAYAGNSVLLSTPSVFGSESQWRLDEYVDSWYVPPAFSGRTMFAVDYFRQSAVRVTLADSNPSVDVIRAAIPPVAGGIATDGTSVFTRTRDGIVKTPVGSDGSAAPTVVVPASTCSVVDPADGSDSLLEDDLAVDGGLIYTACRNGANAEIRTYDATGALKKTIGATPYAGALTHLRVTTNAVYWLAQKSTDSSDSALWRAGK